MGVVWAYKYTGCLKMRYLYLGVTRDAELSLKLTLCLEILLFTFTYEVPSVMLEIPEM